MQSSNAFRFEPKGGASMKQQIGRKRGKKTSSEGIFKKEAKKTQEKKALEKSLASCLKSGHSVENVEAIVSEFLRKQKR